MALRNFLAHIVDYAGLFPPAALDLKTVVGNYACYAASDASWMLGRLIVPAGRLNEFHSAASEIGPENGSVPGPWKISALVPGIEVDPSAPGDAIKVIQQFNANQRLAVVDAIEVKCPKVDHIASVSASVPDTIRAFLEIPHQDDPAGHIEALAALGRSNVSAKVRTGGLEGSQIPSVGDVARFITRCVEHRVGFKATAGLHHPLRSEYRLTYESDSERATMHGFLNVFAAALVAFSQNGRQDEIAEILENRNTDLIRPAMSGLKVGTRLFSVQQVDDFRNLSGFSFGSCSFDEPVNELAEIGLDPAAPESSTAR